MLKVILLSCLFFACNVLAEGNVLVESNVLAESVEQLKAKAAQGDIIAQSQLGAYVRYRRCRCSRLQRSR